MSRLPSEDTPHADGVRPVRHHSALGWWEMTFAAAHPSLASCVTGYCGWEEETVAPLWRLEPPGVELPLIILFGAPVLARRSEDGPVLPFGSFVAGLYDRPAIVGSRGRMSGVQVNFTPIGARLMLGQPLRDFANQMVEIEDLWGADARRLTMALAEAGSWRARFDLLDRFISGRLRASTPPHRNLQWCLERLVATGGAARVDALARDVGWSRRHLIARVREEFGLTPGSLGRVLRLGRAVDALKAGGQVRLADVAADCGYYDQAHFSRDFREFTGMTPGAFLGSRLPDSGGIAADR